MMIFNTNRLLPAFCNGYAYAFIHAAGVGIVPDQGAFALVVTRLCDGNFSKEFELFTARIHPEQCHIELDDKAPISALLSEVGSVYFYHLHHISITLVLYHITLEK